MPGKRLGSLIEMIAFAAGICIFAAVVNAAEKPVAAIVSIPPQQYFVEQIGGDRVSVDVLLPAGESPATFTPEPSRITGLAASDIYFRIGVPFENMVMPGLKTIGGDIKVVDTRQGVPLRAMQSGHEHGHHVHHGHPDHSHSETHGKDPHIWLAPMLVKQQAFTIRDALCKADPQGCPIYKANTDAFAQELSDLHETLKTVMAPVRGERFFVFHPAFGYFADAYGMEQVAVEMEGKAPKGRDLLRFIKQARDAGVRVIFVQPQFDRRSAQTIADAIDGAVVPLDPLAADYVANMTQMAQTIKQALAAE